MTRAQTIYGRLREVAATRKDRPAIIEANRTLTFSELLAMVDAIADTFPVDVKTVGIVMSHRAEMIASMFAVLKCGARYVPAEPTFPAKRIRFMMEESKADFVLTERPFLSRMEGLPTRLADCELCSHGKAAGNRPERAIPESAAYVLYTSGTTGTPKGVCVTNRNVCHYARAFAEEFQPQPEDIMLQYSVCSFDIFVEEVFATLLNGIAVAIPTAEDKTDIHALMRFVTEHRVTMMSGFPYLFAEMNKLAEIPRSLRLLISGGDVLRASYVDRLLDRAVVYNTYGPSETTVCASYYRCRPNAELEDGTYPIGQAVEGTEIRILDAQGNAVPDGDVGEICIYGDGVSRGYIGDHAEENRAFVTLDDGSTMYRSGDLGYRLPDGNLAFCHRKDSQVMILGKRVETKEVESRLHQCAGVRQAVVNAVDDDQGLPYLIAYVVPEHGQLQVDDLRSELAENLADFMIPEYFVSMPRIPLNENGKPDTAALPVVMKAGTL